MNVLYILRKIFSENWKPIRVWLWLVYKIAENSCSRVLAEFSFQLKRSIVTFLIKKSILTWRLLVISRKKFSCELNSSRTYFLGKVRRCNFNWEFRVSLLLSFLFGFAFQGFLCFVWCSVFLSCERDLIVFNLLFQSANFLWNFYFLLELVWGSNFCWFASFFPVSPWNLR